LTASLACTQAAQPLTSPSASTGGSLANAADGTTLKMTAPGVVSPIDGVRAEDRRPTLIWLNSNGRYGPSIGVAYDIQLSTPAAVVYERTVGESSEFGAHLVEMDLDYDTVYSWRIRAHVGNPDTVGPWSNWTNFLSPTRPTAVAPPTGGGGVASGGCAAPISALAAGENRKPRPNDSATVRAVANAYPAALQHSCQPEGGTWEFMDRTVDALRAVDGRYGYNCKRGNCNDPSLDVASYFYANGTDINGRAEVYIFDLIGGHCGSTPSTIWTDVTDVTFNSGTLGRTTYPRPGRVVAPCATK
jgi:hypothetical protein